MEVDSQGGHVMACKRVPGKTSRHHALNDVIWRAFYLILVTKFVRHLVKTKKHHSFFSTSLFFNVSILCFCRTLSSRTLWTN